MLPAATAAVPDAVSMAVTRPVTVVLPLVPVMATIGRSVQRDASSTSPTSGTPRSRAIVNTGCRGGTPGLGTTSSALWTSTASVDASGLVITSTPSGASSARRARTASLGESSTATTSYPRSVRARATAAPLTPRPTTTARPAWLSPTGELSSDRRGQEVGVVRAHGERRAQPGEDPEAHDHRGLGPAHELEVLVDGRHAAHPPVKQPERQHLADDRHRLDDEHTSDDRQQQLGVRGECQRRQPGADRLAAHVSHEDERRSRVPPQKPGGSSGHGRGDDGEVERRADVIQPDVAE